LWAEQRDTQREKRQGSLLSLRGKRQRDREKDYRHRQKRSSPSWEEKHREGHREREEPGKPSPSGETRRGTEKKTLDIDRREAAPLGREKHREGHSDLAPKNESRSNVSI